MTFTLPVRSGQIQASCRRITLHRATRSICTIHHWLYVPTRLLLTGHRRQESAPAIRSSPKHVAKQEKARTDHRENQSGVLSAMKERILDCRRFCSGRSTKAQQRANKVLGPNSNSCNTNHLPATEFNRVQQSPESGSGPGGRRFKSSLPDQSFQELKRYFWYS